MGDIPWINPSIRPWKASDIADIWPMSIRKPAMGRGLSALLKDHTVTSAKDPKAKALAGGVFMVDVTQIAANPDQPRTVFSEEGLQALTVSIQSVGLVQPITVRQMEPGAYQIISGERRYRAAKRAGLKQLPVYVRFADDQAVLEMALVENIQRQNLDPIEVALSYQRLMDDCDLTQQRVSERVGVNRSSVANHLGLMKLPSLVQAGLRDRAISMGHARALVGLNDSTVQEALYLACLKGDWSVRQMESAVKSKGSSSKQVSAKPKNNLKAAKVFESALGLQAKVTMSAKGNGSIVLQFKDKAALQSALDKLKG
jgi:ParB family chromosome partitioning protein